MKKTKGETMNKSKKVTSKTRDTVVMLIEADMCNINGDPGSSCGGPRLTSDGHAMISQYCFKSHMRRTLEDHSSPAFKEIMEKCGITDYDCYHIWESQFKGFDEAETTKAALAMAKKLSKEEILNRYVDLRLFGTTILEQKESKDALKIIKTGPVLVQTSKTIDPVNIIHLQLAKRFPLEEKKVDNDHGTFGDAEIIEYGIFMLVFEIDSYLANTIGLTTKDIEVMKTLIPHLFYTNCSSARPGSCGVLFAATCKHDSVYPIRTAFIKNCTPILKDPTRTPSNCNDYDIVTIEQVKAKMSDKECVITELV